MAKHKNAAMQPRTTTTTARQSGHVSPVSGRQDNKRMQQQRVGRTRRKPVLPVEYLCCAFFLPVCLGINANIPLIGEEVPAVSSRRNGPGCIQDGHHYRFEEKWSPVLIPRGTMHCVKCECMTVEKKGIIQPRGRVKCKNIKNECPKPKCLDPVLRPDRCCKVCPGSPDHDFETNFSFRPSGRVTGLYSDDQREVFQVTEFRALLVGRHVRGQAVRTRAVAVVYLTALTSGELGYAVRYSRHGSTWTHIVFGGMNTTFPSTTAMGPHGPTLSELDRPKYLQITDANGYILLDSAIVRRSKKDKQMCGAWQKVPAVYVQYLRQGRLFAVITSSKFPDGLVAGRVAPNDMASTEVFSSVLSSPKAADGGGGVASLDYNPSRRVVSYVLHVDGLVDVGAGGEFHVSINKGKRVIHQTTASTTPLTTKIAGSWKLTKPRERKQLARGRLRMYVTSHNGAIINGVVYPRLVCGVFQAVLSGSNAIQKNEATSAGSAILELGPTGGIDYKIRIEGLESPMTKIRLEGNAGKRKRKLKQRIVGSLHRSFVSDNSSFDGWANGTYKKLEAKDVYNLLNNKLYINIVTTRHRISQLRGRLVQQAPYSNQFNELGAPTPLVPATPEARGGAAHAWLTMTPGCSLQYHAVLASPSRHGNEVEEEDTAKSFSVLLGSYENRLRRTFLLGPAAGHLVTGSFEYNISSGSVNDVPQGMIKDLDQGKAYLQILSGPGHQAVFTGNVTVPNTCWQYVHDPDSSGVAVEEQQSHDQSTHPVCMFEGTRYSVGDSWLPDINATCFTCSCMTGGSTVCHKKMCAPLTCENPVRLENQCCATCPEETWSEYCDLDEDPRKYPLHHAWHPFLPLKGFAKCAVCTCKEGNTVECGRVACPKLNCPGHQLVRLHEDDCCQICGPKLEEEPKPELPQLDTNMEGACNFLGQWKPDGETWHPRVKPFGHLKCFVCHCKSGKFACGRKECPALNCRNKVRHKGACCDECDAEQPEANEKSPGSEGTRKGCSFGGRTYEDKAKWRPSAAPNGNPRCARCRCQNGVVKCKIRCPKRCLLDVNSSPCCRHCPDEKRSEASRGKSTKGEKKKKKAKKQQGKGKTNRRTDFPLT